MTLPPSAIPLLQTAAMLGWPEAVQVLLAAGTPPDLPSGSAAAIKRCLRHRHLAGLALEPAWLQHVAGLHLAAALLPAGERRWFNRAGCIELLLAAGAAVDALEGHGRTALEVACSAPINVKRRQVDSLFQWNPPQRLFPAVVPCPSLSCPAGICQLTPHQELLLVGMGSP
jgi:hypothetical protein